MGLLRDEEFICLDCEATGLDTDKDEIVELAVVKFRGKEILSTFETLIDPKRPIPKEAKDVHHISDEMVQGKPAVQEILPTAFDLIGNCTVVGHNIGYDLSILISSAKRHNIPCPLSHENSIDTLRLARLYGQTPSNTLEVLREHFNIPEEGAHRAMNDVIVNIKVFQYLVMDFRKTEEVKERLTKPIQLKAMPLGKHKGKAFKELPIDYLHWASNQDFDQDLLYSLEQEKRRRRKRKSFSSSINPFSDL